MILETLLVVGILNLMVGVLVLVMPDSTRLLVSSYFLVSGGLLIVLQLVG